MRKIFLQLHLWLSLPVGLIITILCLTGAILIFEEEIRTVCYPSCYKASMANEHRLFIEELVPLVKKQLPDSASIFSIQIPMNENKNYRISLTGQGRTSILADPYTGEIKGKVIPYEKGEFFSFIKRLHRWFLFEFKKEGIFRGRIITGVSTLVFVFILITGIIVWLPKTGKALKRRVCIKTSSGCFRFWYDTHLAGGMWILIPLLVMCLTGLTWSFNWYRDGFYKVFGVEVPQPVHTTKTTTQLSQNIEKLT